MHFNKVVVFLRWCVSVDSAGPQEWWWAAESSSADVMLPGGEVRDPHRGWPEVARGQGRCHCAGELCLHTIKYPIGVSAALKSSFLCGAKEDSAQRASLEGSGPSAAQSRARSTAQGLVQLAWENLHHGINAALLRAFPHPKAGSGAYQGGETLQPHPVPQAAGG